MKRRYYDLKCPAMVNFYLNYEKNNNGLVAVNDSVDIYDEVEITITDKSNSSRIYLNGVLVLSSNTLLQNTISAFFDYTKLPVQEVCIKINKKVLKQLDLGNLYCIAAGVLLILNTHYQVNLNMQELANLAFEISPNLPYYMYGGYQRICFGGKKITQLKKNRCDNYLIAFPDSIIDFKYDVDSRICCNNYTGDFYNCFESQAPEELLAIRDVLLTMNVDKVCVNGLGCSVLGYFSNYHDRFKAREFLKKIKVKTLAVKPVDGIKIRRRYK